MNEQNGTKTEYFSNMIGRAIRYTMQIYYELMKSKPSKPKSNSERTENDTVLSHKEHNLWGCYM